MVMQILSLSTTLEFEGMISNAVRAEKKKKKKKKTGTSTQRPKWKETESVDFCQNINTHDANRIISCI